MGKMSEVTAESLAWRIGRLEEQQRVVGLSIKDVYNLAAYEMLLGFMVGAVRAEEMLKEKQ